MLQASNRATVRGFLALLVMLLPCQSVVRSLTASPLEYNRDVRPILAENCFACHGPDSAARKASLRLDRRDDAVGKAEAHPNVGHRLEVENGRENEVRRAEGIDIV